MRKRKFFKFFFYTLFLTVIKIKSKIFAFDEESFFQKTVILTHPVFSKHIISYDHPESPERIKYILKELKERKLNKLISNFDMQRNVYSWIDTIHSRKHINSLKKKFPLAEKSSESAVKACLEGIDLIMKKKTENVFCVLRPPGHHALNTGKDEGFCFYNHIAIAAKYLKIKYKKKKILIVDWDYHHGNSTEHFFYKDPSVLFFSTHDANAYPRTGFPNRKGEGKGKGFNVNVHLPCGTKDKTIISVFKDILEKKADDFKPDFILISAGFDSRKNDTLGCFEITDNGFKELTKIVMNIASKYCNEKILSILEGGYNVKGNAKAVVTHIETLNNFNKKV